MTLQPGGRKLCSVGNYKFTGKRLGKGNFAKVEEAVHSVLNVKVAIKIMDVGTIKEEYVIRNLYREAKIMSRLSHPCIAALFQTMQYGNMYYLVTELVGGGDLCNFIKGQRNGRLEEHYTRVFARQLISAISHMHNLGIVHRDLKMENVMLNQLNDRVKIVDFGLSNIFNIDSPLQTHCGSPEYAAPELFVEGRQYGPEVDLWSLGVILYGMVVGQLPFVSSSRDGAATSHAQRRKKLLEQINKGLSAPHKKALALFSTEFKGMMAKLLVADSTKRIKIRELNFHPWVTEKGHKAIRSNPLKKLDEHSQTNIYKEISTLTKSDTSELQLAIKNEPHGNVAGMFNILARIKSINGFQEEPRHLKSHLLLSPSRPNSSKPSSEGKKPSPIKRQVMLKSAPQPKMSKLVNSLVTPRRPIMPPARPVQNLVQSAADKLDETMPKLVRTADIQLTAKIKTRKTSSEEFKRATCDLNSGPSGSHSRSPRLPRFKKTTPTREQITALCKDSMKHELLDKRYMPCTQMLTLSRSPAGDGCNNHASFTEYDNIIYNMSCPANNTRSKKSSIDEKVVQPVKVHARASGSQSANVASENGIAKVGNVTSMRRPLTTGPSHTAERAAKRRSMLPVITNRRMPSKSAVSSAGQVPVRIAKNGSEKHTPDRLLDDCRNVTSPAKLCNSHRMELSNDPIARSIAGYVTKNISSKIESLKCINKAPKVNIGT